MKSYVLLLVLSSIGTIALGQVKVKPQIPLMEEKESKMPVFKLDSSDEKYHMPIKKPNRVDGLAPMPGTEKMPKGDEKENNLPFRRLNDSLKVKDFKLKIDSLYPNKQKK
ncbi:MULTISPECIES: hypothetical protein [Sphingobacterium]|jgi:hypothetical protein|nr:MULTISPECIES: hypothetical protein [Sphingobacterium]HAE69205.1 hypothetical protein [Sphingobacterium sp.]MDF2853208.1 hypothetical protein [Sphingobacterium multivorum]OFV19766.1 hypothetical protein HMPREF3127_03740 [Sphingobacterium sp. HMSC13C05]QQT43881.1 hypothetical protein I6J00_19335 [Sphingobacterium multivorum]QQT63366.1 hypothetical protein I6I97_06130 [Sphingobacterium multivorum]